jgi:ribonuclease HII
MKNASKATRQFAGRLERILGAKGFRLVAGVDEVGRGALAGPLVAASVLLDTSRLPEGLCDSKMLEPSERERLAPVILSMAVAVSYIVVDPLDVDDTGLGVSNVLALRRAVRALPVRPDYVISDHFPLDDLRIPWVGLPKADCMSAAVAAASIVAKVSRDRFMHRAAALHPGWGFDEHVGYSTPEHREAILRLGVSPLHRLSFQSAAYQQLPLAGD